MTAKEALDLLERTIFDHKATIYSQDFINIIENGVSAISKALSEFEELKANQIKIKTIASYGIDDILAVIQGLKAKEITPEMLRSNLAMYEAGYENGIKVSLFDIEQLFKNIGKVGEEDE